MKIHSTAQVASTAKIGKNVQIGAYAIIEDYVDIGDNCLIDAHACIRSYVKMGSNNIVHPYAVIGGLPQNIKFDKTLKTYTLIGDNNIFREASTVNRATEKDGATRIGSGGYFMNNSHVGHDCIVGDDCIFASGIALGGHVEVGDRAFLGGGAMVHQFCRVGSLAMIAGGTMVRKDVLPFSLVGGSPVRHYRVNLVGLRRAGIGGERIKVISTAFQYLRKTHHLQVKELPQTPEIDYLQQWISSPSKRGIYRFSSGNIKKEK